MHAARPGKVSLVPGYRLGPHCTLTLSDQVCEVQLWRVDDETAALSAQMPENYIDLTTALLLVLAALPSGMGMDRDTQMPRNLAQASCGGQRGYIAWLTGGGEKREEILIPVTHVSTYIRKKMTAWESARKDVVDSDASADLQRVQAFLDERSLFKLGDVCEKAGHKKALAPDLPPPRLNVSVDHALALAHLMLLLPSLEDLSKESDSSDDFVSVGGFFRIKTRTLKTFLESYGVPNLSDLYPSKWKWGQILLRVLLPQRKTEFTLSVLGGNDDTGRAKSQDKREEKRASMQFENMFRPRIGDQSEASLLVLPDPAATKPMSGERRVLLSAIVRRCLDAVLVYSLLLKLRIVVGADPADSECGEAEDNETGTPRQLANVKVFPVVILDPNSPLAGAANQIISSEIAEKPDESDPPSLTTLTTLNVITRTGAHNIQKDPTETAEDMKRLSVPRDIHRIIVFTPGELQGQWEWRAFDIDANRIKDLTYCLCMQQHLGLWLLQTLFPQFQPLLPRNTITRPKVGELAPTTSETVYQSTFGQDTPHQITAAGVAEAPVEAVQQNKNTHAAAEQVHVIKTVAAAAVAAAAQATAAAAAQATAAAAAAVAAAVAATATAAAAAAASGLAKKPSTLVSFGLKNFGDTCFINALLMCFAMLPEPYWKYFVDWQKESAFPKARVLTEPTSAEDGTVTQQEGRVLEANVSTREVAEALKVLMTAIRSDPSVDKNKRSDLNQKTKQFCDLVRTYTGEEGQIFEVLDSRYLQQCPSELLNVLIDNNLIINKALIKCKGFKCGCNGGDERLVFDPMNVVQMKKAFGWIFAG